MVNCALMRIFLFLLTFSFTQLFGQSGSLSVQVVNSENNLPIDGANVFFANTTEGAFTNEKGECELKLRSGLEEELLISHLGYEMLTVPFTRYSKSSVLKVKLVQQGIDLVSVEVKADKKSKRKKWFRKFEQEFLGYGSAATKCKILNPEVIQFSETQGTLIAQSEGAIEVVNNYLGYTVYFYLDELRIAEDGSSEIKGESYYIDIEKSPSKKIRKRREKTYKASLQYFLKNLVIDQVEKANLELSIVKYKEGSFSELYKPVRNDILFQDTLSKNYHLIFKEFLQVVNLKIKDTYESSLGVISSGRERNRFNTSHGGKAGHLEYATSQIYQLGSSIRFNDNGIILNKKELHIYGYWANQKLARSLPTDYRSEADKEDNASIRGPKKQNRKDLERLLTLVRGSEKEKSAVIDYFSSNWDESLVAPLVELLKMSSDLALVVQIKKLLNQKLSPTKISNYQDGLFWLWKREPTYAEEYANFKAEMYQYIDPKFKVYFKDRENQSKIRYDEVLWGGVVQDGIPPLRNPKLLKADQADYLDDNDIVFGMEINGIAKAYPKRILAWHELFIDRFGDIEIAGVYCTLCGTVIPYRTSFDGKRYELGTSGFLYRSNKLMYDKKTQSLWNTIEGTPVIGPLVDKNIKLNTESVVTTTWGEWKAQHPFTEVLSLDTGHERDYGEGVAYSNYFADDRLMFPVPDTDRRLKNKDEVLVVRAANYREEPIAISVEYLRKKGFYQDSIGELNFIALASKKGAARVYNSNDFQFKKYRGNKLIDSNGAVWQVKENELIGPNNERLKRISAHQIFWFAWYNTYPKTRLIH